MNRITLVEGPPIAGHHVQHSDGQHLLLIDDAVVPCTPSEYAVLMYVLQDRGYVPLATLAEKALHCTLTRSTRRMLTQHISRARAKLWPFGFDIRCITGYGYVMLPLLPDSIASGMNPRQQE